MLSASGGTTQERRFPLSDYLTPEQSSYFWSRVLRPSETSCWEWTGGKCGSGYGVVTFGPRIGRIPRLAIMTHRLSFILANGEITRSVLVLHKCDNKLCCNPAHLYAGNHSQNMRDAMDRGQHARCYPHEMTNTGDNHWSRRHPERVPVGSQSSTPKLTEEQVRIIRSRYSTGVQGKLIAAEYGIDPSTVSSIVNGKTWKHVL